jgi:hypothetical protein
LNTLRFTKLENLGHQTSRETELKSTRTVAGSTEEPFLTRDLVNKAATVTSAIWPSRTGKLSLLFQGFETGFSERQHLETAPTHPLLGAMELV